jgi:hypothetical protein
MFCAQSLELAQQQRVTGIRCYASKYTKCATHSLYNALLYLCCIITTTTHTPYMTHCCTCVMCVFHTHRVLDRLRKRIAKACAELEAAAKAAAESQATQSLEAKRRKRLNNMVRFSSLQHCFACTLLWTCRSDSLFRIMLYKHWLLCIDCTHVLTVDCYDALY